MYPGASLPPASSPMPESLPPLCCMRRAVRLPPAHRSFVGVATLIVPAGTRSDRPRHNGSRLQRCVFLNRLLHDEQAP